MKILVFIMQDDGKEIVRKVVTGGQTEFGEIEVSQSEKNQLRNISDKPTKAKTKP